MGMRIGSVRVVMEIRMATFSFLPRIPIGSSIDFEPENNEICRYPFICSILLVVYLKSVVQTYR